MGCECYSFVSYSQATTPDNQTIRELNLTPGVRLSFGVSGEVSETEITPIKTDSLIIQEHTEMFQQEAGK